MADLRTNYKDDVLDTSVNDKRKYQMIQNSDGTVSFNDVTTYTQNGDSYGSNDVNETNEAVNALNNSLTAENNQSFEFAYNSETDEYGYKIGDEFMSFGKSGKIPNVIDIKGSIITKPQSSIGHDFQLYYNTFGKERLSGTHSTSGGNNVTLNIYGIKEDGTQVNIYSETGNSTQKNIGVIDISAYIKIFITCKSNETTGNYIFDYIAYNE